MINEFEKLNLCKTDGWSVLLKNQVTDDPTANVVRCQSRVASSNTCPAEFIVNPLPEFSQERPSSEWQLTPQRISLKNIRIGNDVITQQLLNAWLQLDYRRIVQHLRTVHSGQKLSAGSVLSDGFVQLDGRTQEKRREIRLWTGPQDARHHVKL